MAGVNLERRRHLPLQGFTWRGPNTGPLMGEYRLRTLLTVRQRFAPPESAARHAVRIAKQAVVTTRLSL